MQERKPLCLIPARGGSKRFPRKNITFLGGKPLIAWSIEPAMVSGLFDHVWVSSDAPEILEIAEHYGAMPLKRSAELAGDQVALEPVCKDAVLRLEAEHLGYTDLFMMLPTSPFRQPEIILSVWQTFLASGADALMSVFECPHPPQWALRLEDGKWLSPYDWEGFFSERQQLVPLYRHDGAYFITQINTFIETGRLMGPKTVPFRVPRLEAVDIDEPIDLAWAEFLLKRGEVA